MTLTSTRKKNLYRKAKNLITRYQRKGLGFIRYNQKTVISLDISNSCPKEEQGNPCKYCYKHDLYQQHGKSGFEQGKVYQKGSVCNEKLKCFLTEWKKLMKQYGNEDFSVRLFSVGDYKPEHKEFWCNILQVFAQEGVKVHAITKQYEKIQDIAFYLSCVNLSVDNIHAENNLSRAIEAKKTLELITRVKIRSVVLNNADLTLGHKTDIVTVYHGKKREGLDTYRTDHKGYIALANKLDKEEYHGKVCCTKDGKCINCKRCQ